MPILEFLCPECTEKFEIFLRTHVQQYKPLCPKCHAISQRVFSPVYSNFQAWSETTKRTIQDAMQWEPDIKA